MKWVLRALTVFVAVLLVGLMLYFGTAHGDDGLPLKQGDRGQQVTEVQYILISHGYVNVTATGYFGPKTDKAVRHWQKVNGLDVDGKVGRDTWKSLQDSVTKVATAPTAPKKPRRGQPTAPSAPEPPATPQPGAGALPTKSPQACADMSGFRQAAGLPDVFDAIGYREGGCRNDSVSRTGCCVGYWQNFISSHLSRSSAYRDRIINDCGVTGRNDILGNSDAQKAAQACVTFVVWDVTRERCNFQCDGMSPWAL